MGLGEEWQSIFVQMVQEQESARALEDALRGGRAEWTVAMTGAVIAACTKMGWTATGKGHGAQDISHGRRAEYLGMDVTAFPASGGRWRLPVAVFELENDKRQWRIAYSLWKLICVRADLRVLICYRELREQRAELVRYFSQEVIGSMRIEERIKLDGETVVVVGSRGEAGAFPYAFFGWWRLEKNTGKFEAM